MPRRDNGHLRMTPDQFVAYCRRMKGAQMATMICYTYPELRRSKSSVMEGRIRKRVRINVVLTGKCKLPGGAYGRQVNRQRDREGHPQYFQAAPRSWGTKEKDSPLVTHTPQKHDNERTYVEVKIQRALREQYYLDDKPVEKSQIEEHLRIRHTESGRQQLENPVVLRDYAVDSIEQVWVAGLVITIDHDRNAGAGRPPN